MIMVLYFDDSVLDLMAEIQKVKVKMSQYDCLVEFKCFAEDKFQPFNARQKQAIILKSLENDIDIEYLEKQGVILDHFPMHARDRELIQKSWDKYKWRLSFGFIFRGFLMNMQPLNFIKDYYGEKYGFYFAWLIHYTGQLIIPSILGLIFFIV